MLMTVRKREDIPMNDFPIRDGSARNNAAQHATTQIRRRRYPLVTIVAVAAVMIALIIAVVIAAPYLQSSGMVSGPSPSEETSQTYPKVTSAIDFDGDGIDDYTDLLEGARKDAENHPTYDDGYYQGGYPPEDRGACTDVIWRAFRNAGYDLKAMVDADIAADPASYAQVASVPDPNIDFRRTGVLNVFFSKYATSLTTDTSAKEEWQRGDIVVFESTRHIGMVSDKRDADGNAFIIHNMGQKERENDYLAFKTHMTVTAHYRFDASKIDRNILIKWTD